MILVFGSINIDLVARVPSIPRPGETVLSPGYEMLFGGKGANQAVAAGRVTKGTGTTVSMAGRVGDDEFGRAALANLKANEVLTDLVVASIEPTGCAFIAVDEKGENAITVAAGANAAASASSFSLAPGSPKVLVLQMEVPFAASLEAAKAARQRGGHVIWNLAPVPPELAAEDLVQLLGATDTLIVNEHEAGASASILREPWHTAQEAAAAVARAASRTVVLTAAAAGAFTFMADGARHHAAALPVEPVDTTGAGDTFVGVFAAELTARGGDVVQATRHACVAASLSCLKLGAQTGMPGQNELRAALRQLGSAAPRGP